MKFTVVDGHTAPVRPQGDRAVPVATMVDLHDLPAPAALCDEAGYVVVGNGRLRSGLPVWMHARAAGIVPMFVPRGLDPAQHALLEHGGALKLDLESPRRFDRSAPCVCLHVSRPVTLGQYLVLAELVQPASLAPSDDYARGVSPLSQPDVQLVLEAADLGSWEWHIAARQLHVSRRTLEMLGYDREEFPQEHDYWRQLLADPGDGERTDVALREYLSGRAPQFRVEQRLRRRDGGTAWLLAVGRAVEWDDTGRAVRIVGLHFDITERALADKRLQESEARFRALADDAPVLIWTAGVDGQLDYYNRRWLEFTGYTLERQIEAGWESVVHPDDRLRAIATYEEAVRDRMAYEMEYRMRRSDGVYRWVAEHGQPRWLPGGEFIGFIGSCTDITDRREAVESLAISQSRFKLAFAAWGAGYFEYARDFSRGYVDRRFAELFDLAATDLPPGVIIQHAKRQVLPEDLPSVFAAFGEVLAGHQDVMDFTYRLVTPDGRRRWVRTMGQLVAHDPETPDHDMFAGVVFDVSEEHALQDRLSLQLAGLEAAANAIMITDRSGRVVWVNPAFTTLTGYAPEEVLGHTPAMLRSGLHQPGFYQDFWQTISSGRVWSGEIHNKRKDGTIYAEEMTVTPVRSVDGEIAHFIAIKGDITERKCAEAELIAARNAADAASQMKGQFLAMMSHELRTPLNGLIGFTELLRGTPLTPEQSEYVATMRSSSETLLAVINDILDFSKVEAGRLELDQTTFSVREVMRDVGRLFAPRATERGLRFEVVVEDAVPECVSADVTRLRQVVANLIGNAVKFTERGRVDVRVAVAPGDGRCLAISVADTGIGIPADRLSRLFQPFSQVDASTTRRYGGTGLGLSICERIVRLMGGTMEVTSAEGKGSTFRVTVPVAAAPGSLPAPQKTTSEFDVAFAARHPLAILVVEDNLVNQKLARATLRKFGYAAEIASGGREAIARVARGGIDLVLMDVQMPEMDGFEATQAIRELAGGAEIYISAMTAHSMEGDSARCFASGMNDYVAKPFRPAELAAALMRGHAWLCVRREPCERPAV